MFFSLDFWRDGIQGTLAVVLPGLLPDLIHQPHCRPETLFLHVRVLKSSQNP